MTREARNRAEGEQKGTRKDAPARKAVVDLFTALEPPLGSNPIFRMRQEAFGLNELEDCGCAYLLLNMASWPPSLWKSTLRRAVIETAVLLGEAKSYPGLMVRTAVSLFLQLTIAGNDYYYCAKRAWTIILCISTERPGAYRVRCLHQSTLGYGARKIMTTRSFISPLRQLFSSWGLFDQGRSLGLMGSKPGSQVEDKSPCDSWSWNPISLIPLHGRRLKGL
eukprot:1631081-Pleurochrysis_carterae.AAC.1